MKYKNGMLKALTALILSLLCLVSCASSDKGSDANENKYQISGDVSTDLGYAVAFLKDGKSDYQIVRPDAYSAHHIVVKAVQRLSESIEAQSGIKLELSTDWVKNAQELEGQEHAFEILVGNTNRKETESVKKTLRENDYAIQVMGN